MDHALVNDHEIPGSDDIMTFQDGVPDPKDQDGTLPSDVRLSVGEGTVTLVTRSLVLKFHEPFYADNQLRAEVVIRINGSEALRRLISLSSSRDHRRLLRDLQMFGEDAPDFPPSVFHIVEDELEPYAGIEALPGDGRVGPWPSRVDGEGLADAVVAPLERHLYASEAVVDAVTLWVLGTWVVDEFHLFPILSVLSPSKRCGKSTMLTIISTLVRRPLLASSVTPAAIYNAIAESMPTLLIDEADVLFARRQTDLIAILNAGHSNGGEVLRASSTRNGPGVHRYKVYGAKCLAGIGRFPSTVEDRSIVIPMHRPPRDAALEPLRTEVIEAEGLRTASKLCRWAHEFGEAVGDKFPEVPAELGLREADNWRPLLAIAALLGKDWPDRAWRAAIALSGRPTDDQDPSIELLAGIREVLDGVDETFVSTTDLIARLVRLDESQWADPGSRRLTARKLALLLAPFGIRSQQPSRGAARGFFTRHFLEAWLRYLAPDATDASAL